MQRAIEEHTANLLLPFGASASDDLLVDLDARYAVEDGILDVVGTSCLGVVIQLGPGLRERHDFLASVGPEACLADGIAGVCETVYSGRIRDRCIRDAQERGIELVDS
jgi:hypothetical protein